MRKLLLTIILSFITFSMWADDSGKCGTNLSWNYVDETLTISGSGEMIDFQEDGNNCPWNKYKKDIFYVNIESGVTSIGNYAFSQCVQLTAINIPDGLTSIGEYAFWGCIELRWDQRVSPLKGIKIPNSVTSIGDYAFRGCKCLKSIELSNNIVAIKQGVFEYCKDLTAITIPNSVTRIGQDAFNQCTGLSSVNIGNNVKEIDPGAFMDCSGMTSITIPNSVTSIGDWAFSGCSGLTTITIGNSVTSIGDRAFSGCSGLTTITIGNSVTSIGDRAFSDCSGLTSITIPNSVTSIGDGVFSGCSGLTSITIPNSVTSIGNEAFKGCNGLTSITIPNSVTSIGSKALEGCNSMTSIVVEEGNPTYDSRDNCNALIKTASNSLFMGCQNTIIPISVTSIEEKAFYGCSGLTSITIPYSVTSIGGSAFSGCSGLTSVTIPNSVKSIEYFTFSSCSGLTSINIPSSVLSIGEYAFDGCTSLTSITIPENVTSIGGHAFDGTAWLDNQPDGLVYAGNVAYVYKGTMPEKTSITIKSGTRSISDYAFYGCSGLTSINIPSSVLSIGWYAFMNCSGLTSINIPSSVLSIGRYAFYGCSGLTSINIPSSVLSIGGDAFDGTAWLDNQPNGLVYAGKVAYVYKGVMPRNTSIIIKDGTVSISGDAFRNYKNLTSITIPNSVTNIGEDAFYQCTGLSSVNIGNNVKEIGYGAFYGCNSLTSISIPNSVTSIDNNVFRGCSGLTSVTIGKSVTRIGQYAFSGCTGLSTVNISDLEAWCRISFEDVSSNPLYYAHRLYMNGNEITNLVIPECVTSIGDCAFLGCSGLTSMTIPNSVTSIGDRAFLGCSGLTTITIGNSVTCIGDYAFSRCSGLIHVFCNARNVPLSSGSAFNNSSIYNATLHVPEALIDLYKAAEPWKNFKEIVKIDIYTLTYIIDNEVYKSFEIEEGENITPESAPTKEGYTFSGWSDIPETMPAKDVTVTGTFSVNSYTLLYVVDGEEYKKATVDYGTTLTAEVAPTKEGYTFSGWSEIPETMPAKDVTVTGSFTVNSYKVTFKYGDEVLTTETVEFGAVIPLPESLNSDRYTLVKWLDVPETMPARDIIIQADYVDGIKTIQGANSVTDFYQLSGVKNSQLKRGLNIIHTKDGKTQKVRVKYPSLPKKALPPMLIFQHWRQWLYFLSSSFSNGRDCRFFKGRVFRAWLDRD